MNAHKYAEIEETVTINRAGTVNVKVGEKVVEMVGIVPREEVEVRRVHDVENCERCKRKVKHMR